MHSIKSIIILISLFLITNLSANADRALYIKKYKNEQKIALVIGNSKYKHFSKLRNTTNDSYAIKRVLKDLKFTKVFYLENGTLREMENIVRKFSNKLKNGGVGFFYYAGHGIEVNGNNYLIPVDAEIADKNEVKYQALAMNMIIDKMQDSKNRLNIVVLDACRNDPFSRSGGGGLAQINNAKGMYIAYSTSPGEVASDGSGKNGLFTKYLINNLKKSNLTLDTVFNNIRKSVYHESHNKQLPWTSSSVIGDFYFKIDNISYQNSSQENSIIFKITELLSNLSQTKYTGKDFDYSLSYGGMRVAYYYLASYLPYKTLSRISPYPIFLSGPHTNVKLNLNSNKSFGHYNPEFLNWLYSQIEIVLDNDVLIEQTRINFKKYLGAKLQHYIDTYKLLEKQSADVNKIKDIYKYNKDLQNQVNKIPFKYKKNYYEYNGKLAALFWFRRYEDGTYKEVYKILNLFYMKYYENLK